MLKKILIFIACITTLSGCSLVNNAKDSQNQLIQDAATQDTFASNTTSFHTSQQTQDFDNKIQLNYYDYKDNIVYSSNENIFDESLFWNYLDGNDGSRGFIIPIERLSDNYELYITTSQLIDKKLEFESKMNGAPRYEAVITDDNPLATGTYYEANPEYYFGCTNIAELNEYYCSIYVGKADAPLSGFKDIDGKLHVLETGGQQSGLTNFMEWNNAKFIIYDETDVSATLIAGVPHWSGEDKYYAYSFYCMELINTENGWRLSDQSLWYN